MFFKTLKNTARQQLSMFYFRGLCHPVKAFHLILILSYIFFCLTTCAPCPKHEIRKSVEHDACGYYENDNDMSFPEVIIGDGDTFSSYTSGSPETHLNVESACPSSHSFCFPSTLPSFWPKEHGVKASGVGVSNTHSDGQFSTESTQAVGGTSNRSWLSDYSLFELQNGRSVSCTLSSREDILELSSIKTDRVDSSCGGPLVTQRSTNFGLKHNFEVTNSGSFDVSFSPKVEIRPPVLDWGKRYLFFPSVAFLTVANTCNDSILHLYEPFSTNVQFYPCNFSEVLLGPGEVASLCFVFLPRLLGFSSAHLVLQTSVGGFLVQAKGFTVESPYEIEPSITVDSSPNGWFSKNLSLFNPFDETVFVEEITTLLSISMGNTCHHTEARCIVENSQDSYELNLPTVKDWLVVSNGQVGFPLMAFWPQKIWEVGPHSRETILELDLPFKPQGKVYGAFCMQLTRSSQDKSDTVLIPLEVDMVMQAANDDHAGQVSVSLEAVVPYNANESVLVALSLITGASQMLSVVKVSVDTDTKFFHIKYMEGLLLFPGTITQVAVVSCSQLPAELRNSSPEGSNVKRNCKFLILTNMSSSPEIEIPCMDVVHICLRHQKFSSIGYEHHFVKLKSENTKTGSQGSGMQLPSQIKADELILRSWKSQGTTSDLSVLDDRDVLFPMVQVGSHFTKWVTVKNPSQHPVVMQLILNSGEIVDECKEPNGFVQPPSSSGSLVHTKSLTPTKYGFSIAEGALTEAYVHPYGKASFGPIFFHPSKRCRWRSSVLIRNNLSGVEWLSLSGSGGSLSFVLLEGSDPVQSIEFDLNLPIPLNLSPPDVLFHMEETSYACSQPLIKELYAKNTGDFPLEVSSIDVSGRECGMDGFKIHSCSGFSLEPGESMKLQISYRTNLATAVVHRDLELALATGIFVIPMKASLPLSMLNLCKKSMFWMRLKKLAVAVLIFAALIFLVFCCIFPQVIALGLQDHLNNSEKSFITMIRGAGKSSRLNHHQRSGKFSVTTEMDCLLRSAKEDKTLKQASVGRYNASYCGGPVNGITAQHTKPTQEIHEQISSATDTEMETALPFLSPKSVSAEKSVSVEAPEASSLTVRTGKEKGKRRRKRKGAGSILSGVFEVSSSQSGNSTPSSPLSPVASTTPSRTSSLSPSSGQTVEVKNPFSQMVGQQKDQVFQPALSSNILENKVSLKSYGNIRDCYTQEQPLVSRKTASRSVLFPSATFPCSGRPAPHMMCSSPLASTSTISPLARAPGSKFVSQGATNAEVKARIGEEYTYDIWGDHFSGLHLEGRPNNVRTMNPNAAKSDSDSFFLRGPQTIMKMSQPRSVSWLYQEG